jgi:hypothetical protein
MSPLSDVESETSAPPYEALPLRAAPSGKQKLSLADEAEADSDVHPPYAPPSPDARASFESPAFGAGPDRVRLRSIFLAYAAIRMTAVASPSAMNGR